MSRKIAKNTFYFTVASIGQKVIAFVYFLFVARIMMPENTGAYFLALSITSIFSVITDFGMTPVLVREVAKKPEETINWVRKTLGAKLPFMALGAMGALIAGVVLQYSIEIQQLIWLACLVMLLDAISLLYYGVLRGQHALKFESLGIFIGQTLIVIFGALVLIFRPSLLLLILALVLGSSFNALFSSITVARRFGWKVLVPKWSKKESLGLLKIAFPFALAAIFVKVFSYIDTVFISKFIGNAAVGVYAVAYKFTYAFQFLPLAFIAALYPGFSSLVAKKDHKGLREVFDKGMWYMAILAVPIVFGIFAISSDIVLLAGDEYASAGIVLSLLVFALLPLFLDYPIGSLLNAADRQTTKTAIMGVTMIINVVANVILIPMIGLMGAAVAAVTSFSFMFLAGLYFVPRIIEKYTFRRLLRIVLPIALSGIIMCIVTVIANRYLDYVLVIPIGAVVYIAMLFATKSVPAEYIHSFTKLFKGIVKPYVQVAPHDD